MRESTKKDKAAWNCCFMLEASRGIEERLEQKNRRCRYKLKSFLAHSMKMEPLPHTIATLVKQPRADFRIAQNSVMCHVA